MTDDSCTRRSFLAGAGLAVAGGVPILGAPAPAAGQATASPAGPPVGLIDVQSHLLVPELVALMKRRKEPPLIEERDGEMALVVGKWHRRLVMKPGDIEGKLAAMDAAGVEMAVLSSNDPGPELFGPDARAVARMVHDYLGEVVKRHPRRFVALASLPLTDIDVAMGELDRAVGKLGMKGILLYSNLAGQFPDEPQFRPLFQRAEHLDLPIFLHPAVPTTFEATKGYNLTAGLGLPFDTTIALCRIIVSGILDEYPGLKIVCPHTGGTLPYLIGRIDHQVQVLKRAEVKLERAPSEYLRNIYLDAVNPLPLAIRHAHDFVGPDRLLYASDHPWVDPRLIADGIRSLRLPAETEAKIFRGNARALLGV